MIQGNSTLWKRAPLALVALALGGCALLGPPGAAPPSLFTLAPEREGAAPREVVARTIEIAPPGARPGFEGPRMAYVTRPYEIQYFSRHQWVEPPARMLAPLLGEVLERDGSFQTMLSSESGAPALRLESEIVALQQEFTVQPSQVRFTLRARLLDGLERRVLATAEFEAVEPSPSEDPYGGVIAANRAAARVLGEVAKWCAENGAGRTSGISTFDRAR
jgi:cholesterol transport system auxiliary component